MTKRKVNDEVLERIADMRERGCTIDSIMKATRLSRGAVEWHCLTKGIEPPKPQPLTRTARGPAVMHRGDHIVRRYSPEEDERILAMRAAGKTPTEIGRAIGRKSHSVLGRLHTLARHQERAEA